MRLATEFHVVARLRVLGAKPLPTHIYAFMVWCFNKYRDHIACLLYLYLKETRWKNLMCPGYSPILGCCEHDDEPLSSMVVGHFSNIWLTVRLLRWSSAELVKINIYVCLHFTLLKFIMLFQKKSLFIFRNYM